MRTCVRPWAMDLPAMEVLPRHGTKKMSRQRQNRAVSTCTSKPPVGFYTRRVTRVKVGVAGAHGCCQCVGSAPFCWCQPLSEARAD